MPESAPDGWALVDIKAVGICGTDYHILEGKHPFLNYPRVIGHELSGRVAETTGTWSQGQLVVVNPYLSCNACRACRRGKPNCCSNIEVLGVHRDGGLCARIAVPQENLYPATGLTDLQAAMVEFLAIGAHAVRRAALSGEDRVLVTGAGPIGIGTALFARLSGAEVHLLDVSRTRLNQATEKFGFKDTHLVGNDILSAPLQDGFDVIFDATGNAQAIEAGFSLLAHGSRYVLVSVVKETICFSDPEFHKRETQIIGSRNATGEDFEAVMSAIRASRIDTDALCTLTVRFEDLQSRINDLAKDREALIKAIVTF
ncbi:zinc-binding alcohol dehydrogenase family protein [Roseibium sp. DSM 29163]|uniref:Zinc-binding alcohol dehydrogenase family protein n=2 Tax=Roseibium salinum TaxID=1604349 RepID=A0ABT3QWF5_9HYPH|nr:zinc-binding alcohol dehydrogenase family protein [Roseibium sp. DSM 29163]MCX2721242.1 zinc-binding alcohol dehydrogenase family protein [Roseibium sp. DSM 29163]